MKSGDYIAGAFFRILFNPFSVTTSERVGTVRQVYEQNIALVRWKDGDQELMHCEIGYLRIVTKEEAIQLLFEARMALPMYKPTQEVVDRINNDFSYHPPIGTQIRRYEELREHFRQTALLLVQLCPPSRELSVALTGLKDVSMQANAAIAINEKNPDM